MAKIFSVSTDTIANWELNRHAPGIWMGKQIIEFLGYNPHPEPQVLSEQLLAWRWREGLGSREAALRVNIDPATWAKWERGERIPDDVHTRKLILAGVF